MIQWWLAEVSQPVKATKTLAKPQDSLAAMEAFTKMAAKRDEEKGEREAKTPLLNETSFDRRRTMAVYKHDGSRGHHMGVSTSRLAHGTASTDWTCMHEIAGRCIC